MSLQNNLTDLRGKKLLLAPLDWGLGHATRCIPIIKALKSLDCEIWLAGEGQQESLLKTEFPDLSFLNLDGYRVKITGKNTTLDLIRQVPAFYKNIKAENKWLDEQISKYGFEVVISDNRYGLYNKNVRCIFITHQLTIKSPLGKWSERLLQKLNYSYINRFDECWVPDEQGENNLAGILSHPASMPSVPVKYIGVLSRFEKKPVTPEKNHLLIMISGPEPQRSYFENKILNEIAGHKGTATIVRGLPGASGVISTTNQFSFYIHLPAHALNEEILKASIVISRSGYSTVMDLISLDKKSILTPTPGQTEQEWLARRLHEMKLAYTVSQEKFSLQKELAAAESFDYRKWAT